MAAMMTTGKPRPLSMNANNGPAPQKKIPVAAISILIPKVQAADAEMSSNRQLSPGGRRINNPGRVSDSFTDPYRSERHGSYTSPRASVSGVIPISTQTFVNYPPASSTTTTRPEQRYDSYSGRPLESRPIDPRPIDSYSGRPRRSSLVDTSRGSVASTAAATLPNRNRPNVIQTDQGRPTSPPKGSGREVRDKDYYVTPAASKPPHKVEHKKLYSVNDGQASLVADIDAPTGERHHRRRESDGGERLGYRGLGADRDRDRGRRGYHPNGSSKPKEKSIDDQDAYSYTDAAGMFRDTEPRWREREARPRRGSVDRGGASRERPASILDPNADARRSNKDIGPPPSTRGWAHLNDGLGRASSLRNTRDVPQSPNRARVPQSPNRARAPTSPTRGRYADPKDPYYVPPRTTSEDRRNSLLHPERANYDQYEYEERREPRHHQRRNSVQKPDHSVERRGFGIRADSQDRYGRVSDESFGGGKYREPAHEPHRRDTAPEINWREEQRLEQQKQERTRGDRDRNYASWRDDGRSYKDYEQDRDQRRDFDVDRERERERERMMQPPSEHDRHHYRHESNREYSTKDNSRPQNDVVSSPGLSSAAAGGLAGAAAAFGVGKMVNRTDDRDRERDRDFERREGPREQDRDRLSPRPPEQQRPQETHSDEGVRYTQERERPQERDRGLGFAFENPPEPPRSAPPVKDMPVRERYDDREAERQHEDRTASQAPLPVIMDADEDYRRRMEQVQRELGRAPDDRQSDSDPDRERRRRERELRQRDRHVNGDISVAGTASTYDKSTYDSVPTPRMPGSFESDTGEGAASRPGLPRKRSILDEPMGSVQAQVIDNTQSDYQRENRVRIVDPPSEYEEKKPKGILKKPTDKFPDHSGGMREGVAPLKDVCTSNQCELYSVAKILTLLEQAPKDDSIPEDAKWTKINRQLVNPQALEEAKERFEERLDCVIVLRVVTKQEIQKFANRTKQIRGRRTYSNILQPISYGGDWRGVSGYFYFSSDMEEEDDDYDADWDEAVKDHAFMRTDSRPWALQRFNTAPPTSACDSREDHDRRTSYTGGVRRPHSRRRNRAWSLSTITHSLLYNLLRNSLTYFLSLPTEERYEEEREQRRAERHHGHRTHRDDRRSERDRDRRDRDEYIDENSEDEFKPRAPKMLEAPGAPASTVTGASAGDTADFVRERDGRSRRDRDEGSSVYASGGLGRREDGYQER